jgi:hypothetical protein
MHPTDRYVRDPYLAVMASSDLDLVFLSKVNRVDDLYILRSHAFQDHKVLIRPFKGHNFDLLSFFAFDRVWKFELAELTVKSLPAVSFNILIVFKSPFGVEPVLEALDVDRTHGSSAFAGFYEGVIVFVIISKADTTDFGGGGFCHLFV